MLSLNYLPNNCILSIPNGNTSDPWHYSSQVQAHQDKIQKLSGDIKERTDNLEDRKKEIEDTNKVRSENICTPNKANGSVISAYFLF